MQQTHLRGDGSFGDWQPSFQANPFPGLNTLTILARFSRGLHAGQPRLRRDELLSGHRQPPHRPAGQAVVDFYVRDLAQGAILYLVPLGPDPQRSGTNVIKLFTAMIYEF